MSQKIKPGHVLVEVVQGVEGPSLSIGDNDTGERVAGPKPWGGGRTIHCFQVAAKDLIRLAKEYASAEPSAPVERDERAPCQHPNAVPRSQVVDGKFLGYFCKDCGAWLGTDRAALERKPEAKS